MNAVCFLAGIAVTLLTATAILLWDVTRIVTDDEVFEWDDMLDDD